jgi:hypothetical protein
MGSFSLDIERYYQQMGELGNALQGIFAIQYPIYCIHSIISDLTPDPLDEIDKLIIDFLNVKSDLKPQQIASVIGSSKTLVEIRLEALLRDGLIEKRAGEYRLSNDSTAVFIEKRKTRQHKRSFDFYLDGVTLEPLPKIFYSFYRSRYLAENETYIYTNSKGETKVGRPFAPDLVHTPPDKDRIKAKIYAISQEQRDTFSIPTGLEIIDDMSFSKLTLQLLVGASIKDGEVKRELIDGFAFYSIGEGLNYHEILKRNIQIFEPQLISKISNLEFRIAMRQPRAGEVDESKGWLTTNWNEIDKAAAMQKKCFSFSSEDLTKMIHQWFQISLPEEAIVNSDTTIEVKITRETLLKSSDRPRLLNNLLRKRDYKFGSTENNVYLIYVYFSCGDTFVQTVLDFKSVINRLNEERTKITEATILNLCPESKGRLRELLIASGEFEILEQIDIEHYMACLNK